MADESPTVGLPQRAAGAPDKTARPVLPLVLAVSLFATFAYFFHANPGWNVNSRIALTYAIVEKGTFAIEEYPVLREGDPLYTEDIAFCNGHYYSDKIIGTSLLGVAPMTVLHVVSRATGRDFSWNAKRYVVRTFSVSALAALAGLVLYRLLLLFGASAGGAIFLVSAFFFGTQMFSVSTVFLSYAPAMCFSMASYAILAKRRETLDGAALVAAGLLLGAALLCEYTVGIVAVGLTVYAIHHLQRKRAILWFCLAAALPLSFFVAYTLICFGEPTIPYKYLVRTEFKEGMSQGFQGIIGFNPTVLYYITIHRYRGLLYHSPFLVLALWGWIGMWRDRRRRSDAVLSISMVAAYLVFNASYYMWWGGWTNGPRHLIPSLPFYVLPLVWVWKSGRPGRALLIALAAIALFFNTLPAMVDAQIPQGYTARELRYPRVAYNYRDPLWELGVKGFLQGNLARNAGQRIGLRGHWSLAPLVLFWVFAGTAIALVLRTSQTYQETAALPRDPSHDD